MVHEGLQGVGLWERLTTYRNPADLTQEYHCKFAATRFYRVFNKGGKYEIELRKELRGATSRTFVENGDKVVFRQVLLEGLTFKSVDICYENGGTTLANVILYSDYHPPCCRIMLNFQGEVIGVKSPHDADDSYVERYLEDRVCVVNSLPYNIYSSGVNIMGTQVENIEIKDKEGTTGVVFPAKIITGVDNLTPVDIIADFQNHDWIDVIESARRMIGSYRVVPGDHVRCDLRAGEIYLSRVAC